MHRLLKGLIEAIPVVFWLLSAPSGGLAQNQRPTTDPTPLDSQKERLSLEKNVQVAVLVPERIDTKNRTEAKGIVASDVLVDDVIIVRKGESVLLNLAVSKPGILSTGGVLTLYIEAIRTLDGIEVPLAQKLKVDAGSGCAMEGCAFVFLVPWVKGPHAAIPAGTLIGTHVAERTEISAEQARFASAALLRERQTALGSGPVKVFSYMAYVGDPSGPLPDGYTLKIDGKEAARLGPGQWACFALADGNHTVRAEKQQIELDVSSNKSYYLKIEADWKVRKILQTPRFELDDQTLHQFVDTKKAFKTECW